MILEDFVMLGKTVPESNSDGRLFVCTAGYSFELRQAVRVYPMARASCPKRWSMSRIPLERNTKDSRPESWKIKGDRSPGAHDRINDVIQPIFGHISQEQEREIIKNLTVSSLKGANERRLSLCVVQPKSPPRLTLEEGWPEENVDEPMPDLFGDCRELPVMARFRWHPRLRFEDELGRHDLMLRDWGCYELMRKHGDDISVKIGDALGLSKSPPLFCGNLNRFRNSWLIISVFSSNGSKSASPDDRQLSMFGGLEATAA